MLLSHNERPYEELTNILSKSNYACLVMGTGVGKSYITLEYLTNHNLKALIVSPRNSINDSWKKLCGDSVDTITYQKLANIYKTIDYSFYDIVICDEVHHVGASKWGAPIKYLIDNNIIKVFGLTESPVRYSDGARDISEEFFNGNVVFGENVPSAIEKGILNPVTYVGAMYNSDGLKKTIRGKIQSRLYAKLNLAINKTPTVTEIIKKNMPSGKRKGIIFASTIDDIKFAMDFVHSVYPNIEIRYVHSKQSDSINETNMEWFKNVQEGYICSVDMISEGVHIKGVNTLIMLRRTESVNLFNQQLGRCLDASSKEPAILFDLVNNKYSIRIIKNKLRVRVNSIFDTGKINIVPSEQLIVKDYTKNMVEVLKEIQDALDKSYTLEEDEIIRNNCHLGLNTLCTLLPDRSASSIATRVYRLGLRTAPSRKLADDWSKEEIDIIMKYFPTEGSSASMCARLPNRLPQTINFKAKSLGLKNPNNHYLDKKNIDFIIKYYPSKGCLYCAKHLDVSATTIKNYVRKLDLKRNKAPEWTDAENEILKTFYPIEGPDCYKRLPGRARESCRTQATKLGCVTKHRASKWTSEEIDILVKYYPIEGPSCCARIPNKNKCACIHKASKLGITFKNNKKETNI